MNNSYIQQIRCIIKADTPLSIGCGQKNVMTDALVATDVNGLPYLPGSSITGILRNMLSSVEGIDVDTIFGWQKKNEGLGSRIIFSEGKILDSKKQVVDGLRGNIENDPLLIQMLHLPIRQHNRLNASGTVANAGKFDEQVIYAGTEFCFQVEMSSDSTKDINLRDVIKQIGQKSFRIGGGSRKGFGKVSLVKAGYREFKLTDQEQRLKYLNSKSILENDFSEWDLFEFEQTDNKQWKSYTLSLQSDSFFLFGSGMGDLEGSADMTYVTEQRVEELDNGTLSLSKPMVLIPASSIKGAIAHRVAFNYNKVKGYFAGDPSAKVGEDNDAVKALFGSNKEISCGRVLVNDILLPLPETNADKYLNHVSIDAYSGGAMAGALFAEKATYKTSNFNFEILVNTDAFINPIIQDALEMTLDDLCQGRLPLGGGVNRGHGSFCGHWMSNDKKQQL